MPEGVPNSKLVAHYAARFTSGVEGQTVSTLPDVAGNGAANLFQNQDQHRATWVSDAGNGLPALRFGGTDFYRAAWNRTIPEPYQIFMVFNTRTPFGLDDDEVYFSGLSANASDKHQLALVDHVIATVNQPSNPPDWMIEQAGASQHVVGDTPLNDTWYVVRTDWESTDRIVLNGVVTTAVGNAGSLSSRGITLGTRENETRGATGDIAELMVCQNLTNRQKRAGERMLMNLYGIT